jgi:tetratricopeptide (TPR) repeat protein
VRLLVGDSASYEQLGRHFIDRAGQIKDPDIAFFLCRACLVRPQGLAEPARLMQWAEQAVAIRPRCEWYLHVLGAAHYRAGQFDQAIRRCHESLEAAPKWPGHVQNWLVLAMAHQRLGQTEQARQWLEKAGQWREKIAQGRPRAAVVAPSHVPPSDWLEFLVLYPEAQALVRGPFEK